MSTHWNQQLSCYVFSKVIVTKHSKINRLQNDHRMQNKWTEEKEIFELKYGNRKLSNVWKYNQVRLVFADFASINF